MNTPTPLVIKGTNFSNRNAVYNGNKRLFVIEDYVYSNEMALQRAAEIFRAVNYHDRMVDMVQKLVNELELADPLRAAIDPLWELRQAQQLLTEIKESNGK